MNRLYTFYRKIAPTLFVSLLVQGMALAQDQPQTPAESAPVPAQEPPQEKRDFVVKGKLVDDLTNEPIIGAFVYIKGTKTGGQTDVDGNFEIKTNLALPITLAVSYVGYQNKEIEVYDEEDEAFEIRLRPIASLSEIVVVGYGEQKRSDVTGSVSSVPTELKNQPVASVERLLQGSIAGAIVTQTSGQPGGGVSVQIRGANSITASSDPLYVIDGFPINNDYGIGDAGVTNGPKINPLSTINSNDIESIDVLKDASATAIYGSRGANGVILVTTKKGKHNESSITYDGYYGVQEVVKTLPLLNAGEWWQLRKDAAANTNPASVSALATNNKNSLDLAKSLGYTIDTAGVGTDWQKAGFRQAAIQNHTITILTGGEKTRVAISGNYFDQDGVLLNTGFKRFSTRLNLDHDYNKRFKIQTYVNASATQAKVAPDAVVQNLLLSPPSLPIYKNDGTFLINSGTDAVLQNPINSLENQKNITSTNRLLGNLSGEYRIIDGLTAKVLLGIDGVSNKQNRYLPRTTQEGLSLAGLGQIGNVQTFNWLNENTLNYSHVFNKIHNINAVGGFTAQKSTTEGSIAEANNFATDFFEENNLGTGVTPRSSSSFTSTWALASFLGRVNYSLREKYLLTLTVRSDGSSRFGEKNKWGHFPSAAIGWNVHKERFLAPVKAVSNLKLRASLGLTGNQSIPPYSALSQLQYYRYNFSGTTVPGYAPLNVANPDLGWEKTLQFDIGADLGLFNDRVNLVLDYYYKKTTDLLLKVIVPGSSGLAVLYETGQPSYVYQNLGAVQNNGFEVALNTQNFIKKFKWNTVFVFSTNRNKVLDLGPVSRIVPNTNAPSVVEVGQPLGSFIVYETDGLIQPHEAGPNALTPQAFKQAGGQKYKDLDGDGVITQAGDRKVIPNNPGVNFGLTNTFNFKGFDLSIFFQSTIGAKLYNNNRGLLELNNGANNGAKNAVNRYSATNTDTDVKAAYIDPAITISDRFIEDASYLRLKNVSFGYTLPEKWVSKVRFKSARFYVSAQNAWTYTKYTGFDPEVSQAGQALINRGVDLGVYPNAKTYLAGVSLGF